MRSGAHPGRRAIASATCAALWGIAALLWPAAAPAQGARDPAITYRTLFQDPGTAPTADLSLERHAIALIGATAPGERITFAFRDFNRMEVVEPLIAAHRRGVVVHGVIDGDERTRTAVQALVDALGPNVVLCGSPTFALHSCIADTPYPFDPLISPASLQHNKFLTFSKLPDGRRHVVLQTSQNFLAPTQLHYYNDMVEIAGDRALYDAYVAYAMDMHAQRRTSDRYAFSATGDDGRNTMFQSPRPQPDVDTDDIIVDRLDEIDCSEGGVLRVAQMAFRTQRAVIMRRLVGLRREGCDVEVIVSNIDGDILAGLVAGGVRVRPFFVRAGATTANRAITVHNKFFIVDARSTVTGRRSKTVYTGSSNWRPDQQYSDDLLLRIIDDEVHDAYDRYWTLMRDRATTAQNRPASDKVAPRSALGLSTAPAASGWHRWPVTVRVAASDGVNVGAVGLRRLSVELSGAQTASHEVLGEEHGYSVLDIPVTAEGVTTVRWFAEDASGNREPARTQIVRIDRTPPTLSGLGGSCVLWPPRDDMREVATVEAADALSGVEALTVATRSNLRAADADDITITGLGADAGGTHAATVALRASKAANGAPRTYRIAASATDAAGNTAVATGSCVVPRSMARG